MYCIRKAGIGLGEVLGGNGMRLMFWVAVLVAIGWGIGQLIQRFLAANPPPSF